MSKKNVVAPTDAEVAAAKKVLDRKSEADYAEKEEFAELHRRVAALLAERTALRATLEEAGKDTARLDWLETACAEVRRPVADTLYVRVPECVRRNADGDCTRSRWLKPHYGNARHAIDSARLASTETEHD